MWYGVLFNSHFHLCIIECDFILSLALTILCTPFQFQYTFRKDLPFCPTFNKLRTFYLVDWCLTSDISALLRFLHHTPNLEKLTLELCEVYVFHLYNLVNY